MSINDAACELCSKYCNESWFVSVGVGEVPVGSGEVPSVVDGLFLYVSSEQSGLPEVFGGFPVVVVVCGEVAPASVCPA